MPSAAAASTSISRGSRRARPAPLLKGCSPMCYRLQPHTMHAATLCVRGCNPVHTGCNPAHPGARSAACAASLLTCGCSLSRTRCSLTRRATRRGGPSSSYYALMHSRTHPFAHPFTYALTYSLTHVLTTRSLTHLLTHLLTCQARMAELELLLQKERQLELAAEQRAAPLRGAGRALQQQCEALHRRLCGQEAAGPSTDAQGRGPANI